MGEWLKPAVLKTVSGVTRSGVRIPLPPPFIIFAPRGPDRLTRKAATWPGSLWFSNRRISWRMMNRSPLPTFNYYGWDALRMDA
jgi:hypothetical protein